MQHTTHLGSDMKQSEFVAALRNYAPNAAYVTNLEREITKVLADHTESLHFPYSESDWWRIEDHICGIVGHALNKLLEVANLEQLEVMLPTAIYDATKSQRMCDDVRRIVGSSRAYINTEFLQFAEEVYDRGGLYAKLDECKQRGMTGVFGDTTLRSYVLAGRVMLTFVRTTNNGGELLASFICNDGDPHGVSGGITALYAEPWDVVQMLREVRDNWAEQAQNYTGSESVSLI